MGAEPQAQEQEPHEVTVGLAVDADEPRQEAGR